METHERDVLLNPEGHTTPARRREENESSGPDALIQGRPEALSSAAVIHLQKAAGNASVSAALEEQEPSLVKDVVNSGSGAPLDKETRGYMESSLGADFGDVRIHTDSNASESARAVQAHAYTVGNDVVFQSGKYAPESESGRRMLAHELTHVVQQRSGPVDGTAAAGGIKISTPSDRFEQAADSSAERVMSGSPAPSVAGAAAGMQRAAAPEEEELQGAFVQRAATPEEEELQGAFVQRAAEEEEELQGSFLQREAAEPDEDEADGAE